MSTRRAARTLDERVATIEEFVRRLQGDTAVSPTDTRFLYSATGDILVAVSAADPQPLAAGAVGEVLTMQPSGLPAWEDPDRVRLSDFVDRADIAVGDGVGGVTIVPVGPDGTVLTANSAMPGGVQWV